jgi:hypothetical protein
MQRQIDRLGELDLLGAGGASHADEHCPQRNPASTRSHHCPFISQGCVLYMRGKSSFGAPAQGADAPC